jgi:hypothetical protein
MLEKVAVQSQFLGLKLDPITGFYGNLVWRIPSFLWLFILIAAFSTN